MWFPEIKCIRQRLKKNKTTNKIKLQLCNSPTILFLLCLFLATCEFFFIVISSIVDCILFVHGLPLHLIETRLQTIKPAFWVLGSHWWLLTRSACMWHPSWLTIFIVGDVHNPKVLVMEFSWVTNWSDVVSYSHATSAIS